jgi:hypothetical protein
MTDPGFAHSVHRDLPRAPLRQTLRSLAPRAGPSYGQRGQTLPKHRFKNPGPTRNPLPPAPEQTQKADISRATIPDNLKS